MKTQYTPGPWYIEDDFIEPNQRKISSQGLGLALTFGDTEEEAQANATLVSAAPEMFEVLQAIINIGDIKKGGIAHGIDPLEYAATIAPMCRAAITKAEGGQP